VIQTGTQLPVSRSGHARLAALLGQKGAWGAASRRRLLMAKSQVHSSDASRVRICAALRISPVLS